MFRSRGARIEELLGRKAILAHEGEDSARVRPIASVDDHVESHTAERGVRTQTVDADVQDVDVRRRGDAGERVEPSGLVIEPEVGAVCI